VPSTPVYNACHILCILYLLFVVSILVTGSGLTFAPKASYHRICFLVHRHTICLLAIVSLSLGHGDQATTVTLLFLSFGFYHGGRLWPHLCAQGDLPQGMFHRARSRYTPLGHCSSFVCLERLSTLRSDSAGSDSHVSIMVQAVAST
jgi:hypothetical protein